MPDSVKQDHLTNALLLQKCDPPPRFHVRVADLALLAKKVTVGVIITAVPLVVIGGGLALTRALLHWHHSAVTPAAKTTDPSQRRMP